MKVVSYELAQKLKKCGFSQPCLAHYDFNGVFGYNEITTNETVDISRLSRDLNTFKNDLWINAPTINHVLEWLRMEKEIFIIIQPFPTIATKDKICWSWHYKWNSDGVYMDSTFPDDLNYMTYEKSAIAGIEYVLDNLLIKNIKEK